MRGSFKHKARKYQGSLHQRLSIIRFRTILETARIFRHPFKFTKDFVHFNITGFYALHCVIFVSFIHNLESIELFRAHFIPLRVLVEGSWGDFEVIPELRRVLKAEAYPEF